MISLKAPHSSESECSLLGAILATGGRTYDAVGDKLKPGDFFHEEHKVIFRAIERLVHDGKPADALSVIEWLRSQGQLRSAGGQTYVEELNGSSPAAGNAPRLAEIILERRMARQLIAASQQLQEIAYEGGDVVERISKAQELLAGLGDGGAGSEPRRLESILVDAMSWMQEKAESGTGITGLSTGLAGVDEQTSGLQPGDLVVVAGRPGMGKTALAQTIAENVAIDQGLPVLIFSLEMSQQQSALRSLAARGSVNLTNVMNPGRITDDDDWARLAEAVDRCIGKNLFIDDTPDMTSSRMLTRARRIKRKHGLSLIVVDYLQLMSEGNASRGRNEVIGGISRGLKLMAKSLGVPVIALSQIKRIEDRANKRPTMADLRESGAIEQDADTIILLYRDDYYNPGSKFPGLVEANFGKQRMGPTGVVGLEFQRQYSRFRDYKGQMPSQDEIDKSAGSPARGFSMP